LVAADAERAVGGASLKRKTVREKEIQRRTFSFELRVVRLVRQLPADTAGLVIARQLAQSATSVGANVEEAQGSHSRAEFARRIGIARSEREALYWLRLASAAELVPSRRMPDILNEADEIVRVLTVIARKARQ
jgi:four helix bundle protein